VGLDNMEDLEIGDDDDVTEDLEIGDDDDVWDEVCRYDWDNTVPAPSVLARKLFPKYYEEILDIIRQNDYTPSSGTDNDLGKYLRNGSYMTLVRGLRQAAQFVEKNGGGEGDPVYDAAQEGVLLLVSQMAPAMNIESLNGMAKSNDCGNNKGLSADTRRKIKEIQSQLPNQGSVRKKKKEYGTSERYATSAPVQRTFAKNENKIVDWDGLVIYRMLLWGRVEGVRCDSKWILSEDGGAAEKIRDADSLLTEVAASKYIYEHSHALNLLVGDPDLSLEEYAELIQGVELTKEQQSEVIDLIYSIPVSDKKKMIADKSVWLPSVISDDVGKIKAALTAIFEYSEGNAGEGVDYYLALIRGVTEDRRWEIAGELVGLSNKASQSVLIQEALANNRRIPTEWKLNTLDKDKTYIAYGIVVTSEFGAAFDELSKEVQAELMDSPMFRCDYLALQQAKELGIAREAAKNTKQLINKESLAKKEAVDTSENAGDKWETDPIKIQSDLDTAVFKNLAGRLPTVSEEVFYDIDKENRTILIHDENDGEVIIGVEARVTDDGWTVSNITKIDDEPDTAEMLDTLISLGEMVGLNMKEQMGYSCPFYVEVTVHQDEVS